MSSLDDFKVLEEKMYKQSIKGISIFSCEPVTIIGEQKVQNHEGKILDWYLYNIDHYTAKNGRPFVSLKANIRVIDC
jgi:hypothetical protein